jgi:hypothetical protein
VDPADDPRNYPPEVIPADPLKPSTPKVTLPPLDGTVMWNDAPGREEATHFTLFPTGEGGFKDPTRPVKLTLREYIFARLYSADFRWGQDSAWVFARLHQLNREDMDNSIMFILNHGYAAVKDFNAGSVRKTLQRVDYVPDEVRKHLYPQIGQRIRNSSSYWRKVRAKEQ